MATSEANLPIPIPSYSKFFTDAFEITSDNLACHRFKNYRFTDDFIHTLLNHSYFTSFDVLFALFLTVAWTLLRLFSERHILKPFARYIHLRRKDVPKFCESCWKLFLYSFTWTYCVYVLFGENYTIFQDPARILNDWDEGMPIPTDIYTLYALEFGFYLHSIYATLFMDERRKDFAIMLFHHFLTLFLLGFSYVIRYHKIGVLVLFLHDITDIILEFTKTTIYLERRHEKTKRIYSYLIDAGFIAFALAWVVFRLYWYPLKVIYGATLGTTITTRPVVLCWFFIGMLWFLQLMNVYWFIFIVRAILGVIRGKPVGDAREAEKNKGENPGNNNTEIENNNAPKNVATHGSKKSR